MPKWVGAQEKNPRWRLFIRSQGPFLASVVAVLLIAATVHPADVVFSDFLIGAGLVIVATGLSLLVPWERIRLEGIAWVAILDLIAVAFIENSIYTDLPSTYLLIAFPVLWLAYGFSGYVAILAIIGALLVGVFPFIRRGMWPSNPADLADRLVLPVIASLIVVVVFIAARELRRQRERVNQSAAEVRAALATTKSALQEAESAALLTRAVADEVDAGIVFINSHGTTVMSNEAARVLSAISGYDPETHSGIHVTREDRVTPLPPEEQFVVRALQGERMENYLYWVGPAGNQRGIQGNAKPIDLPDGTRLGTVLVGHDVTNLVNAIRVRDEFLATVTHELLTPLTSVLGYLEVLEDDINGDPSLTPTVKVIERNARQLDAIIGDLLTAHNPHIALTLTPSDLVQLCANSVETLRPLATTNGVTVEVANSRSIWAEVDPRRMQQVIDNLLSNAIKFSRHGHVSLSVLVHDKHTEIRVTDNGRGISPDDQAQIFDLFFRADAARQEAIQGVGIGLSIVANIVKAHRAAITVDSELGHGTTISIAIPTIAGTSP